MSIRFFTHCATAALLVVTMLLAACGDDGGGDDAPPENNEPNNGTPEVRGVRLFYGLEQGPVDVVFRSDGGEDDITVSDVASYSFTDYEPLPVGTWRAILLDSTGAPTGITIEGIIVTSASTTTLVVVADEQGMPFRQTINDEFSPPPENQGSLRVLQQADGATVDIYTISDGMRIGTSLKQGELIGYTELPGATYELEIRADGLPDVLGTIRNVDVPPGQVRTLVIWGSFDPNGDGDLSDAAVDSTLVIDREY